MQNPTLKEINDANKRVIDDVTNKILKEIESGDVRFDGGSNGARFGKVPKYTTLVADKHYKVLHLK